MGYLTLDKKPKFLVISKSVVDNKNLLIYLIENDSKVISLSKVSMSYGVYNTILCICVWDDRWWYIVWVLDFWDKNTTNVKFFKFN